MERWKRTGIGIGIGMVIIGMVITAAIVTFLFFSDHFPGRPADSFTLRGRELTITNAVCWQISNPVRIERMYDRYNWEITLIDTAEGITLSVCDFVHPLRAEGWEGWYIVDAVGTGKVHEALGPFESCPLHE